MGNAATYLHHFGHGPSFEDGPSRKQSIPGCMQGGDKSVFVYGCVLRVMIRRALALDGPESRCSCGTPRPTEAMPFCVAARWLDSRP